MGKDQEERCVTKAIKAALELIAEQDPELAQLLRETVKSGEYLTYSPEPQPPTPRRSRSIRKRNVRGEATQADRAENRTRDRFRFR